MACEKDPRHTQVKTSFSTFKRRTTFIGYDEGVYLGNCNDCGSTIGFNVAAPVEISASADSSGVPDRELEL